MLDLIILLSLLALGYTVGSWQERRHYESILKREAELSSLPAIATKRLPEFDRPCSTELVTGSVVISVDYFKRFISGLRGLVGGRISSYETLIDRARREAILRMKEDARNKSARMVFNVKMETSSITKGRRGDVGAVEVLAYGTAIIASDAG
jgi:uncharacterized protein YbjQ (UPF0145 family)